MPQVVSEQMSTSANPRSAPLATFVARTAKTLHVSFGSHLRSFGLLMLFGLTAIIAIAGGTFVFVLDFRDRLIADKQRELRNTALVLAEQTDRAFQALELMQKAVIEHMQELGVSTSDDLDRLMSGHDSHLRLKDGISGLPHVDAVTIINAQGRLVNFSRYWPTPDVIVADRDYFKALKADPARITFISEPVRNRSTGTWTIFLARKIVGPDGVFIGLVLGAMQLAYFEEFFGAIALGLQSFITLLRDDGLLLARHPRIEDAIGRRFTRGMTELGHRVAVDTRFVGQMDGRDILLSLRRLANYPIVIAAGNDAAAVFSVWQQQAVYLLGSATLAVVVLVLLVVLVARAMHRRSERARKLLEEQKLILDAALNNMSQGLLMFDSSGRLVVCNRRYREMYGLSPGFLATNPTIRDVIRHRAETGSFDGDVDDYCHHIEALVASKTTSRHVIETTDGRWIHVANQPLPNGGWVATHEDITERRKAEMERDQNREFLQQIIDNVPIAIIVKNARDRKIVLVNRAGEGIWGLSRQQVLGKTPHDLFPKARADLITASDDAVARSPVPLFFEPHQNLASDSDGRILTSRKFAIRNVDGSPKYLVSVIEDVTERRRTEEERDRNRALLNLVIENVPTTIVVKDARDFRYVLINKAGEDYFDIPREKMIGRTAHDILPKETADRLTALDRRVVAEPHKPVVDEHTIETPSHGTRTALSRRLCLLNDKGEPQYVLAVVDDLTERRQIIQQLQHAQKMEAIGNLTGGLAHDFNNFLMVMIGNLDILKEMMANDPEQRALADAVLEAALRGADLTRQMLAFARRQPLQSDCIEVNELLAHTCQLLRRTLGENIEVKLRLVPDAWPIIADKAQLEAAVVNIAINARDAMPNGGTLTISTKRAPIAEGDPGAGQVLTPGEYMMIDITDTGVGMAPEVAARAFEPFFTTKPTGKGTGLGLSMVYGFIKQSGGYVNIKSAPGQGTTLRLYLPRAAVSGAPRAADGERAGKPAPAASTVILVVDDNREVRATAVGHLRALGYQVLEAQDGQEALTKFDAGAKVDLLFTDVIMPGGINGKELVRLATSRQPGLKVLYTSGFPGTAAADGSVLDMDAPFIAKPYRRDALAQAVATALAAA